MKILVEMTVPDSWPRDLREIERRLFKALEDAPVWAEEVTIIEDEEDEEDED